MPGGNQIHYITLRGNVIVTNPNPGNYAKVMTLYNDAGDANFGVDLTAI